MCNLSENIWESGWNDGLKEGRTSGLKDGLKAGKLDMLRELVAENPLTLSAAAKKANMTVEEFKAAVKL